ncbi:Rieske (2Fe-2S) protein [Ramlibacter sp.]|uniref:Rieske (2Fe-2S) protein n=1 Tax=Ramlibacter sp. TaxID=1917967 RepID=UPI002FC95E8E
MNWIFVCKKSELPAGGRKVVLVGGREVGVFREGDDFFAWDNACPHAGGPVCQGKIIKRVEEVIAADKTGHGFRFSESETHVVCPWHGYEFNIRTGCHQGSSSVRLRGREVKLEGDDVYLVL